MNRHTARLIDLKEKVEKNQDKWSKSDLLELINKIFDYCISNEQANEATDKAINEMIESFKNELEVMRENEKRSITLSKGEQACIMDWFNGWAAMYYKNEQGEFNVPQNHKDLAMRLLKNEQER